MAESPLSSPLSNRTEFGIHSPVLRHTWTAYNIFVLLSSLLGDTTILISSIKYRAFELHKFIVVIIQHIAVCDLMVSLISVFPRVVSLVADEWVFGDMFQYIAAYGIYYFNAVDLFLIAAMTTSKLIIVKFPFRSRNLTTQRGHCVCTALWMLGVAISVGFLITRDDVLFDFRLYGCRLRWSADVWRWLKPVMVGIFILFPNIIVVAATAYLLVIAKSFAKRRGENMKRASIITTIIVALVYCISILPYVIYTFIGYSGAEFASDEHSFFRTHYNRLVTSFMLINTISNFYIYIVTVVSFRRFLMSSMSSRMSHMSSKMSSMSSGFILVKYYVSLREGVATDFELNDTV